MSDAVTLAEAIAALRAMCAASAGVLHPFQANIVQAQAQALLMRHDGLATGRPPKASAV